MQTEIVRIIDGKKETLKDSVAEEVPFAINLGERELVTLFCSPTDLRELTLGFLFCAGVIEKLADIEELEIDRERMTAGIKLKDRTKNRDFSLKRVYTPGCGSGIFVFTESDIRALKHIKTEFKVTADRIFELMNIFQAKSVIYKETGGVHSAGLSDGTNLLIFKEDIGRHNAVDKVIGEAMLNGLDMKDKILLTSGRIFSDVIFKAQKTGYAILVSRSAPTDHAVSLAKNINLTLSGFTRGRRLNIYSAPERIVA